MSHFTHYASEHEREQLARAEETTADRAARVVGPLARKLMLMGQVRKINQDRASEGLPPLQRPPGVPQADWERHLLSMVDNATAAVYVEAGALGATVVVTLQDKHEELKDSVIGLFTRHSHD